MKTGTWRWANYPRLLALSAGSVAIALAWVGTPKALAVYSALLIIAVLWTALVVRRYAQFAAEEQELVALPLAVAHDAEGLGLLRAVGLAVRDLTTTLDPIYRELAFDRARETRPSAGHRYGRSHARTDRPPPWNSRRANGNRGAAPLGCQAGDFGRCSGSPARPPLPPPSRRRPCSWKRRGR